jgi:hypothetical protein
MAAIARSIYTNNFNILPTKIEEKEEQNVEVNEIKQNDEKINGGNNYYYEVFI